VIFIPCVAEKASQRNAFEPCKAKPRLYSSADNRYPA
jgi:hypothetical protein